MQHSNSLLIKIRKYTILLFLSSVTCLIISILSFGIPFLKKIDYKEISISSAEIKIVGKPYSSRVRIIGTEKYNANCYGLSNFCKSYYNRNLTAKNLEILQYSDDVFIKSGIFLDDHGRSFEADNIYSNNELIEHDLNLQASYFYLFFNMSIVFFIWLFICEIYYRVSYNKLVNK